MPSNFSALEDRSSYRRCSIKKGALKNLVKHLCWSLIVKFQVWGCEFCEISKNTFFYRTPLVAAFALNILVSILMLKVSVTKVTRRIKLQFQRQKNREKPAGTLNQTVKSKVVKLVRLAKVVHIVVPLSYWCVDYSKKWIAHILQILYIKISNQCGSI